MRCVAGNPRLSRRSNNMLQNAAIQIEPISTEKEYTDTDSWANLAAGIRFALETAANVHRGSGHASVMMTHLYEESRNVVLKQLGLSAKKYQVIFCAADRTERFTDRLPADTFHVLSGKAVGLNIGVAAVAVQRGALPKGPPRESGGGTTRLIGDNWIVWADAPDRFEPGTPAYINVIAFAHALLMTASDNHSRFRLDEPAAAADLMYSDGLRDMTGDALLNALLETRIGKNLKVPTTKGEQRYVHLDHSASTPTYEPILNVFLRALRQPAMVQNVLTNETRKIMARVFDAPESEYRSFFTSGTTESVYVAAQHLAGTIEPGVEPVVISTVMEHSSNDLPWRDVPGCQVIHLGVDDEGFFDMAQLRTWLHEYNEAHLHGNRRVVLVSVTGASNVLGTCNDISQVSEVTHQHNARLFVDAAQLVAHRAVSMKQLNIDFMAFSGHKVYAPFGAGALIVRNVSLANISQISQLTRRAEAENAAGIAAMGKALSLLGRIGFDIITQREHTLVRHALSALATIHNVRLYGITDPNSPNLNNKVGVIPFDVKYAMPASTARDLMLRGGIGVRYGCHCAHMIVKEILHIGPRLQKFQRFLQNAIPPLKLQGVVRISFGLETTQADVDAVVEILRETVEKKAPHVTDTVSIRATKHQVDSFIEFRRQKVFG